MTKNSLVGTPLTSKKKIDDLVLWEVEQRYTRTSVEVTGGDGNTELLIGSVITNATTSISADPGYQPSFSDVLCLENVTVEYGEVREVIALVRGPALVNLDEVVRTTNESDADLKTRLADLIAQGVRFVREPVEQTTLSLDG